MTKHPDKPFGCILWDDAKGESSEVAEEEMSHAPIRFQIYGWVVKSDTMGVTIASEWRPGDNLYRDRSFIPRAMVVQEIYYALVKPRKKNGKANDKSTEGASNFSIRGAGQELPSPGSSTRSERQGESVT